MLPSDMLSLIRSYAGTIRRAHDCSLESSGIGSELHRDAAGYYMSCLIDMLDRAHFEGIGQDALSVVAEFKMTPVRVDGRVYADPRVLN